MVAAQRFFAQALEVAGHAPTQVTTDGHDAYPRAMRETLGAGVFHRDSRDKNKRIEQDHRGVKQRSSPLRGFGAFASAARCCVGFEEQRQYCRAQARSDERVALAERLGLTLSSTPVAKTWRPTSDASLRTARRPVPTVGKHRLVKPGHAEASPVA